MVRMFKRLSFFKSFWAILFLLVQTGGALYLPYLTANIVNKGIMAGDIAFIGRQGAVMIVFTLLSLIGALLNMYIAGQLGFGLGKELRKEIYEKVLSFSKNEYDKFGTASLITRNINDVTQVQNIIEMGLKFLILSPLYLIGGIFMTWRLSPELAMVFVAVIPFMAISAVILYQFAAPLFSKIQKLLDRMNLIFREGLTGVKVIRAFANEEKEFERYEQTNDAYTKASISAGILMSVFIPLITLILNIATVFIIWLGGVRVSTGNLEIGAIMAAVSYGAQILMGFGLLTNVILSLPKGKISAERIYEVLDMPLSIKDGEKKIDFNSHNTGEAVLCFENVDFRYEGAERKTLEDVNFTVNRGQILAVIGSTGDGKTSLVNLISRLYDTEKGSVKISGEDVKKLSQEVVHEKVSYTPQKSTLFMGTVRSNMLMAKQSATEAEIWEALETAQADGFIKSLPKGLDSKVEKSGGNFSGGQKQRLCIARTLLKDSDIYVFDDSFSALDFKTDSLVREGMKKKLTGAVTVIVAQRVSTIIDADIIVVLNKGRIAGVGTHEQLKETNEVYQEIVDSQLYKEVAA